MVLVLLLHMSRIDRLHAWSRHLSSSHQRDGILHLGVNLSSYGALFQYSSQSLVAWSCSVVSTAQLVPSYGSYAGQSTNTACVGPVLQVNRSAYTNASTVAHQLLRGIHKGFTTRQVASSGWKIGSVESISVSIQLATATNTLRLTSFGTARQTVTLATGIVDYHTLVSKNILSAYCLKVLLLVK